MRGVWAATRRALGEAASSSRGAPLLGRSSHYAADAPSIPVEREREARCPASICSLPRERALLIDP
jgi:hypothetical protein